VLFEILMVEPAGLQASESLKRLAAKVMATMNLADVASRRSFASQRSTVSKLAGCERKKESGL
jgi:hypothetical protein